MNRRLKHLWIAVLLTACGAETAPEPRLIPDGPADGAQPWFVCRVERDSAEGFYRADTLHCEARNEQFKPYSLDVTSRDGSDYVGGMRFEDPRPLRFYADRYPLKLRAQTNVSGDALFGLDWTTIVLEYTVASAEAASTFAGPEAPFDTWTITIDPRVTYGSFRLDERRLPLRGARTDRGNATELQLRSAQRALRAGEPQTLVIPVPTSGASLSGSAGAYGAEVPFTITRPGNYVVTEQGLALATTVEPATTGPALVRCARASSEASCALVVREGVVVESATVQGVSLPLDGTAVAVASPELAQVVIRSGIEGIDWSRSAPIEGAIRWSDETGVLDLPFDLLEVPVRFAAGVDQAFFDVSPHRVNYRYAWDRAFESSDSIVSQLPSAGTARFAVSPGVTELTGKLTVIDDDFRVTDYDATLRAAAVVVGREALGQPSVIGSGTEVARCWIEASDSQLTCRVEDLIDVDVAIDLLLHEASESFEVTLDPGGNSVLPVADFLPLELTLRASGSGLASALTETVRVTSVSELSESRALVLRVP